MYTFNLEKVTIQLHSFPSLSLTHIDSSPMDTDGVDFTSEGPVITPTFMSTPIPSRVRIAGKSLSNCSEEYCAALRIVGQLSMCTKIMAITAARVPIIKFTVPSLNMSSDISINKRYIFTAYRTEYWQQIYTGGLTDRAKNC